MLEHRRRRRLLLPLPLRAVLVIQITQVVDGHKVNPLNVARAEEGIPGGPAAGRLLHLEDVRQPKLTSWIVVTDSSKLAISPCFRSPCQR